MKDWGIRLRAGLLSSPISDTWGAYSRRTSFLRISEKLIVRNIGRFGALVLQVLVF